MENRYQNLAITATSWLRAILAIALAPASCLLQSFGGLNKPDDGFIFTAGTEVAGANGSLTRELERAVIVQKNPLEANPAAAAATLSGGAPPPCAPMMPLCSCVHTSCLPVLEPLPAE